MILSRYHPHSLCPSLLTFAFVLVASLHAQAELPAEAFRVTNEENTLRFTLQIDQGSASYRVDRLSSERIVPILESSPLGLLRTDDDFTSGLRFVSSSAPRKIDETYAMVAGKRALRSFANPS